MVPILLLFGEIIPKTLATRNNVAFAAFESRPIDVFARLIMPVRWLVRNVADWIYHLDCRPGTFQRQYYHRRHGAHAGA